MNPSCWQLDGFRGSFSTPQLDGACSLLDPALGVQIPRIGTQRDVEFPEPFVLGPTLPKVDQEVAKADVEGFARGGDLVAIYAPTRQYPYRSQAYWRLNSHPQEVQGHLALGAVELVVSKQTDLLDSLPELVVRSQLRASEVWRLVDPESSHFEPLGDVTTVQQVEKPSGMGCFVLRLPGDHVSYAEMVYPLDFGKSTIVAVEDGRHIRTEHHLFEQRLEKGVILRARVLGLWLSRADDLAAAAAHYAVFAASDPPLTA